MSNPLLDLSEPEPDSLHVESVLGGTVPDAGRLSVGECPEQRK